MIMASKKGLCPYCIGKRIDRRIFMVNPEATTCFCPVCMKEVSPTDAIEGYNNLVKKMLLRADNTLFVKCDPASAYLEYASVIELEPKQAHALLGRVLSLIYMGKVRKAYLSEAYALLENTFFEGCNIDEYITFLKKINFALEEYETIIERKLTFKDYFYDVECLKLYFLYLYQIIKIKELIVQILKEIKKEYSHHQVEVLLNLLEINVEEKKKKLHLELFTADGDGYTYVKVVNEKICIDKSDSHKETHLSRYRLSSLGEEKGKRYIKDQVFKDYTKLLNATRVVLVLTIFFLLAGVGLIASAFIFKVDKTLFTSFIASGAIGLTLASFLLVVHLLWARTLRKRKLRIV